MPVAAKIRSELWNNDEVADPGVNVARTAGTGVPFSSLVRLDRLDDEGSEG
jgi:hypothetical protein